MIIFRLLPYVLVVFALLMMLATVPTLIMGSEAAPTKVTLAGLSAVNPRTHWLTVTGGGLYLPDAITDGRTTSTGETKISAYYVPYTTSVEAVERSLSDIKSATKPARKSLLLVKFKAKDFDAAYSLDHLSEKDVFREVDVQGLVNPHFLYPKRLKDYLKDDMNIAPENVTVLESGGQPLTRGQSFISFCFGGVIVFLCFLWIRKRWSKPAPKPELIV